MKDKKVTLEQLEEVKKLMKGILLNFIIDVDENHHPLTPTIRSNLFWGLPLIAYTALKSLAKCRKVIIQFSIDESSNAIEISATQLGELKWSDCIEGEESEENGLCLSFIFNGDLANSKYYIIREDELMEVFAEYIEMIA